MHLIRLARRLLYQFQTQRKEHIRRQPQHLQLFPRFLCELVWIECYF